MKSSLNDTRALSSFTNNNLTHAISSTYQSDKPINACRNRSVPVSYYNDDDDVFGLCDDAYSEMPMCFATETDLSISEYFDNSIYSACRNNYWKKSKKRVFDKMKRGENKA